MEKENFLFLVCGLLAGALVVSIMFNFGGLSEQQVEDITMRVIEEEMEVERDSADFKDPNVERTTRESLKLGEWEGMPGLEVSREPEGFVIEHLSGLEFFLNENWEVIDREVTVTFMNTDIDCTFMIEDMERNDRFESTLERAREGSFEEEGFKVDTLQVQGIESLEVENIHGQMVEKNIEIPYTEEKLVEIVVDYRQGSGCEEKLVNFLEGK